MSCHRVISFILLHLITSPEGERKARNTAKGPHADRHISKWHGGSRGVTRVVSSMSRQRVPLSCTVQSDRPGIFMPQQWGILKCWCNDKTDEIMAVTQADGFTDTVPRTVRPSCMYEPLLCCALFSYSYIVHCAMTRLTLCPKLGKHLFI